MYTIDKRAIEWYHPTMTQTVTAKQFRENFSEILNEAVYGGKKILITRNGKSQAVLVGIKGYNPADFIPKEEWDKTFTLIDTIRSRGKEISEDEAMRIANEAVQAVRKQKRFK